MAMQTNSNKAGRPRRLHGAMGAAAACAAVAGVLGWAIAREGLMLSALALGACLVALLLLGRWLLANSLRQPPVQSPPAPPQRDLDGLKDMMQEAQVVQRLLPAAQAASLLRACGIRLVIDEPAATVLREMARQGDTNAHWVVENGFPAGHPEVLGQPRKPEVR